MSDLRFSVEHIGLPALDPVALRDWYVRVLGAREVFCDGKTPPTFFLQLPGGPMLEIGATGFQRAETGDNRLAGFRHLALRVESIAVARAALEGRGVKFTEPVKPAGGGGHVLFFADAEGNLLHLVERPQASALH
jgi:catechol 2,3-dioxygenase-like lactoylglutathione lyase family enzyme